MFGFGGPKVINMTPAEVKAGLDQGDVILIDVREPVEYRSERIAGATNHPLSRLDPKALPKAAGKTVVLHCAAGGRSARAVAACKAAGVDVSRHLAGGIGAWKAAGLPTER